MQDLRLVGVQEDGGHLLLSGPGGAVFRLRIDEALRVATSRPQHRVQVATKPAPDDAQNPAERLSPRDIQNRIRSGSTAEEVAGASGLPVAHIRRYEGPVLAERAHIAQQAQEVPVSDAVPSHDGYRSAFGDDPAMLQEMVSHRLTSLGVGLDSLTWDAWRRPDGLWTVVAEFDARAPAARNIGEAPPAQWTFNPARKTLQNMNRWAQLLSEIEPLDKPVPARRLSAVTDQPFDFEAKSGKTGKSEVTHSSPRPEFDPVAESSEHSEQVGEQEGTEKKDTGKEEPKSVSLLELLRSRRGQRLGADEEEDDALALLLSENSAESQPDDAVAVEDAEHSMRGSERIASVTDFAAETAQEQFSATVEAPAEESDALEDAQPGAAQQQAFFAPLSLAPEPDDEAVAPLPPSAGQESGPSANDTLEIPRHDSGKEGAFNLAARQSEEDTSAPPTREITISGAPRQWEEKPSAAPESAESAQEGQAASDENEQESAGTERRKPKRSSVPSWDEIVFGTKTD
ncbi:septation protein SepH [Acaricomes phytoseiuli]|uniref:septation protein SepH n=1 Tax=Acaricomes phytoseiuli TaxID=291968 RepID=UPI00036B1561|nr:septation protein SepH [Acaricomes phytoseiuli]MCW1249123.1 septation protein SepH [Acaricomes phytoseiuli]